MSNETKVKEKLFAERTLIIKTSLPCDTDAEIEKRYDEVEDLVAQAETLLEHLFGPGGQYSVQGYSLSLERR